jgi:excisionase family DNA binding protein
LSILETAAALNISRTAVYEILTRGEMTAVKLNGKTMIRSTEVERFFESLPGPPQAIVGETVREVAKADFRPEFRGQSSETIGAAPRTVQTP